MILELGCGVKGDYEYWGESEDVCGKTGLCPSCSGKKEALDWTKELLDYIFNNYSGEHPSSIKANILERMDKIPGYVIVENSEGEKKDV